MFTTPGMYNYSANIILSSALCAWLFHGAFKDAMIVCVCVMSPLWDPLTWFFMWLPIRFLGNRIPPKWLVNYFVRQLNFFYMQYVAISYI